MINDRYADSRPPALSVLALPNSGVFCKPDCSELSGRDRDSRSHPSPKSALEWGYIPCSVCRPMDVKSSDPKWRTLLDDIAGAPDFAVKSQGLLDRGINPDAILRAYRKEFGLSFQDFLRMRRISHRFSAASPGVSGTMPSETSPGIITLSRLSTPLGPMVAAAAEKGIAMLEFADRRMLETQIHRLEKDHSATVISGGSPWFTVMQKQLDAYFDGDLRRFSVPLDLRGTPFQMQVWGELRRIAWGETRSYGEQARALGRPKAVRAVARANGDNPVGIVVPCHRVLGADGSMTGYGGRIWRKEALLRLESRRKELF